MNHAFARGLAALSIAGLLAGCVPARSGALKTRPGTPFALAPNSAPVGATGGTTVKPGATGTTPGAGGGTPVTTPTMPPGATGTGIIVPTSNGSGGGGGRSTISCPIETYSQMERLARPGINEGLVKSNAYLNAYNTIAPTADDPSLGGALNATVGLVIGDAVGTLQVLGNDDGSATAPVAADNTGKAGLLGTGKTSLVAGNFLPDVMRVDMNLKSGYVGGDVTTAAEVLAFSPDPGSGLSNMTLKGRLVGGRWITDDVIDFTLLYIVANSLSTPTLNSDHVDYTTSHATQPYTTFPYLVNPY